MFKSVDTFTVTSTSTVANWDAGVSCIQSTDVPVPGVLALMASGLTGLGVTRRRPA
ncbi:PEP-CTERM sorting domain-containing protein [uncultured Thiodictyon sp.]|uniref:PEP-CTERM sorting domain-containing protein n=1 Tax=uncultured Thiodictyon sp. TaxID=1846217 RepID=UPI0025DEFED2|nr:PEP-CTERM sorting domain-containing protein [uncultured Thiodictyon sp.]